MFIPIEQLQETENRFDALNESPDRHDLGQEAIIADVPPEITKGNILGTDENLVKRKEMLETVQQEPVDFAFERAIGRNDSVYSNFVELIENAKRKVGRVAIKKGNRDIGFATGFMVSENMMLTNWHVFQTIDNVADSELQFFYELDIFGHPGAPIIFKLQPGTFFHSVKELDYCFVAVAPADITGAHSLKEMGYVFLDPALGKLGNEDQEALNIIHHPDGDYKQLSIRENLFIKITPTSIWYATDTAPGSSGSPVFNDQWQVVALHHSGVARKNAAGDYVDKDGNVIPKINGQIDAAKVVWDANEGIRISVILKDLFAKFPDDSNVKSLQVKPAESTNSVEPAGRENKNVKTKKTINNTDMEASNLNNVNISFPASLVEKNGLINITINQGTVHLPAAAPAIAATEDLEFAEIKKLEDTTDYSGCKGYQSRFLGTKYNIPLPQPKDSLKKFIAKLTGSDSIVLKYYNYSTIFHSVKMMPVISGINVDGDPKKRLDNEPRKDNWLRDTRLSFDIQLGDSYYKGSGFDRGHMSRREDADWGASAEDAKRNADLTCMYTNACPQVAKINQSGRKGLWGILEKVVLESGAEAEKGKTAKISVFNGPIFKETDPVFRGIQVPMDFFKIVLWLTDKGNLKATAFKLSQVGLVDDIDFEELDLDQNTEFKEYQCSIASLENATAIDFSAIAAFDTFDSGNGAHESLINTEMDVMAHINKHIKE